MALVQSSLGAVEPKAIAQGRKRAHSTSELELAGELSSPSLPLKVSKRRKNKRKPASGQAFDAIPTEVDPRWVDLSEIETTGNKLKSGPRADQLARTITRPCHPSGELPRHNNHYFRCIASSVCNWRQKNWDRQLPRIYKHAAHCSALRRWKPDLSSAAEIALANMAPGGFQSTDKALHHPSTGKEANFSTGIIGQIASTPLSQSEQLDHAIARLICASGSPTRLVDYTEWSDIFTIASPTLDYSPPSSSYLRDQLIPAESRRALLHMRDFFRGQRNLSLSFDGLTAGEQPIYTVHVCTADRITFLYRADIFYGSHDSRYIEDLLEQVVTELGVDRIASVVSDDTNVTKKARRELVRQHPSILNLADPIHKLNLCIQDICLDRLWVTVLQQLRKLLTYFHMSTQATGKLNTARQILGILRGLQSIGNTRFATIYYAASSVLENLKALYKIYTEHEIDTVNAPLPDIVAEALDENNVVAMLFKATLAELANILEPFARALLCLESTHSTLADVYVFWLGALSSLYQHFASSQNGLLTPGDKSRVFTTALRRFNEAINDAPTDAYITAFFLDPRYRDAAIYASCMDSKQPFQPLPDAQTAVIRSTKQKSVRLTETLYMRVRKQLLSMLRFELQTAESTPGHPLHARSYNALEAKEQLCQQLEIYYRAEQLPFGRTIDGNTSALDYWKLQKEFSQTFLLGYLAEKLFSILPNSMCDERSGSRLTHLYSKLRTRFDAKSMIDQIQFMQWNKLINSNIPQGRSMKPRSLLRYRDIPETSLPEHQVVRNSCEIQAPLSDETGDSWLDPQAPDPQFAGGSELSSNLIMEGQIDLGSKFLIDILAAAPLSEHVENTLIRNVSHPKVDSDANPPLAVIRAADISWD